MILKARLLKPDDYQILVGWWKFWRFTPPSIEFLPDYGTGGIILEDEEGTAYCAGFLYETNSDVAWMEFIVSNPGIKDKKLRSQSLDFLIEELSNFALREGFTWIFSSLKHPSLIKAYESQGFLKGTEGATEMIKRL